VAIPDMCIRNFDGFYCYRFNYNNNNSINFIFDQPAKFRNSGPLLYCARLFRFPLSLYTITPIAGYFPILFK